MGTQVVTFNPTQLPAFAKSATLGELAKNLSGGGGFSKRISIRGGVFRLIDAGKEISKIDDRHLDVVICAAAPKISRIYYAGTYVEGENKAPDCWSADGLNPDESVKEKQAAVCADCPQNVKGSGQGDSRACRFSQRLAVVLANDIAGQVMQLQLPAQSIFGKGEAENRPLQAYARFLAAQKINPDMVVTRLKFDTDSATPKLFFSATRWLTDSEYQTVGEQAQSDDAQQAVVMQVFQVDTASGEAAPVDKPVLPGRAPKAAKEPSKKPEEEPVAAAPTKREKPNGAPPVGPKAALEQLVSAWAGTDDED
jgi:hypothetical protein